MLLIKRHNKSATKRQTKKSNFQDQKYVQFSFMQCKFFYIHLKLHATDFSLNNRNIYELSLLFVVLKQDSHIRCLK